MVCLSVICRKLNVRSKRELICDERQIPGLLVTHDPQASAFVSSIHTLRDGQLHQGVDAELATARVR
jgi:ABC-type lipoprotein export system ATPase subunit